MKWPVAILVLQILLVVIVTNVFMEHKYVCTNGNTDCTKEKLWVWKE